LFTLMTDSDPEPANISGPPSNPQTPPEDVLEEPHSFHGQDENTMPRLSPPASPSFSLHFLGMSPYSPSRRRSSAPPAKSSSSAEADVIFDGQSDFAHENRDFLVQRLNDLAAKLSQDDYVREKDVDSLLAKVDDMERTLETQGHGPDSRSLSRSMPADSISDSARSRPRTPIQRMSNSLDESPFLQGLFLDRAKGSAEPPNEPTRKDGPSMSAADAERIVAEAQGLCQGLESVIASLRARQEESDV
jgi:hypothetical protein